MAGLTRDEVRRIAANIANGRSCFDLELHHTLPLDLAANYLIHTFAIGHAAI
jgi:hypothetical protein